MNVISEKYSIFILLLAGVGLSSAGEFRPGETWLDTDGKSIQAHSGGLLTRSNVFYWYGEDRTPGQPTSVSCYSSTNFYDWKHEGTALANEAAPTRIIERPKVIYNAHTGKYVMWMHLEQSGHYHHAHAGIALSDTPAGPFTFREQIRPIQDNFNYRDDDPDRQKTLGGTFRDMNLFVDDDGKAYVFYASEGNGTMYVVRLNEAYTGSESPAELQKTWARILVGKMREAPAPFKYKGRYYLITSGCTGWAPNGADYAVADNIFGPWESKGNPCQGTNADLTFGAQSSYVIPVSDKPGVFIFLADRWNPRQLSDSRYVWLPLILQPDGSFTLTWRERWDLSVFDHQ